MKWIFWLLAIITVVAALPAAEATFRYQGFGSSLTDFSGPSTMSLSGSGYSTAHSWGPNYAHSSFRTNNVGFAASAYRPSTVVGHQYDNYNNNYRTVEHGAWQLQSADANIKSAKTAVSYRNTPAGPYLSAVSGSYQGGGRTLGYGRTGSYAYGQAYNIGTFSNPWVGHSYKQPSSLSAYTMGTRTYY